MSDKNLETLKKESDRKYAEYNQAHLRYLDKLQESRPKPVRTAEKNLMTGEMMYPKDCTCNFQGSCLSYCNPYK